jgi:hypothetical protein
MIMSRLRANGLLRRACALLTALSLLFAHHGPGAGAAAAATPSREPVQSVGAPHEHCADHATRTEGPLRQNEHHALRCICCVLCPQTQSLASDFPVLLFVLAPPPPHVPRAFGPVWSASRSPGAALPLGARAPPLSG